MRSLEPRSFRALLTPLRRRGLALFVGSTLYVGIASVRANAGAPRRAWIAGLLALGVSWLATRPSVPAAEAARAPRPPLPPLAYSTWGLALALASLAGVDPVDGAPVAGAWLAPLGAVGAAIAAVAASGIRAPRATRQGVAASLPAPKETIRVGGGLFLAAAAGAGVLLGARGDTSAGLSALSIAALSIVLADRLRAERLVLGAAERARAGFGGVLGLAGIAVALLAMRVADPAPLLRAALASAGVLACACAAAKDPVRLARRGRRALALGLFGGPVVLLSVIAAEGPGTSSLATLVGGLVALAVGTLGAWLERPLRPAEGRWLEAFAAAQAELTRADPETFAQGALGALRAGAGRAAESPELWSLDPTRVLTIDAAGYARERAAELPPLLLEVAAAEPEATLRTELLDALLVRRPDLRALARWMDERGALAATLVTHQGEVFGALVVPRGGGREPMTLEEARALKALGDALSGACASKSALARSRDRERDATARAEAAELLLERGRHEEALSARRLSLDVARAMRGADVGRYSPGVVLAQGALERRVAAGAPVVVVGPAGLDPVPHLAAAHAAAARRQGTPFVVVDATSSRERNVERWRDPVASPLAVAHGGLLVLADGAALPLAVQRLVAQALGERRAPWGEAEPLDVAIALTSTRPLAALRAEGLLDASLAGRLGDAGECEVALPPLAARAEDLRALLGDRLAREGLRQRGTPVGIEDAAFARLTDYAFPGDLDELILLARRLVAGASGDVIRVADVERLGLRLGDGPAVNVRASASVS